MRRPRRWIIVALLGIALVVAFLLVKLVHPSHYPRIDIQAEGSDRALVRHTLARELGKLFRGSNGTWRAVGRATFGAHSPCVSKPYPASTGRADTTTYEFARWIELRLFDYIYPTAAQARRAFTKVAVRRGEACRARTFANELRHGGYTVSAARGFSSDSAPIADRARSTHFEIPSRFGKRSYNWHLDLTEVLRGRTIVAAGTVAGRPFARPNQEMASDLATAAGSTR